MRRPQKPLLSQFHSKEKTVSSACHSPVAVEGGLTHESATGQRLQHLLGSRRLPRLLGRQPRTGKRAGNGEQVSQPGGGTHQPWRDLVTGTPPAEPQGMDSDVIPGSKGMGFQNTPFSVVELTLTKERIPHLRSPLPVQGCLGLLPSGVLSDAPSCRLLLLSCFIAPILLPLRHSTFLFVFPKRLCNAL